MDKLVNVKFSTLTQKNIKCIHFYIDNEHIGSVRYEKDTISKETMNSMLDVIESSFAKGVLIGNKEGLSGVTTSLL